MADLSVKIAGVEFKNPIIPASGAFGYGREYGRFYSLSELGGISVKGTTLEKRNGNLSPRIAETPSGMLNSVGLQNPGVDYFLKWELPNLLKYDTVVIANIAGKTADEYAELASKLDSTDVHMLELNVSCPNVKEGGAAFGTTCDGAAQVMKKVRAVTKKPVIIKLTPNVTSISEIAKAVEAEGADSVSLINTVLGMKIDIRTGRPILKNNVGGLSGPAILPIAVRMVWQVANAVNIPVIGMGGITTWEDAVEMIMAGASALQIGAAIFSNPYAPLEIRDGLNNYLDERKIDKLTELIGTVETW